MPGFHLPTLPFDDPVLIFGTIMVSVLIFPALAKKLKVPDIIGLIAAGMILGPFGLGFLSRDGAIELLGKVGLLYIMFLAGLEIDLQQVKSNKTPTLIFGMLTFLIPLGMGTALGYWTFGMTIPVAILLASMFSSHTLLTFPSVLKLGIGKNRAVTTSVGGTIITDTLALLILAVVASSSQGDPDLIFWLRLFGIMIIYMVATMVLVPKIGHLFFRFQGTKADIEFTFVIALTFVISYLAHLAGLEPIIGAFLAGISLNNLIPEKSLLMTRIHFTGDNIFIPFFLISTGMLVNLNLLWSGLDVWIIIIGMVVIALISKALAAWISGWVLGYRKSETGLVYGLSVNQAAATLAAVLVGFQIGLFDEGVITGTIMMIGVTCIVGSLVTAYYGRKVALEEAEIPLEDHPSNPRILIPLANRDKARELMDLALLLRPRGSSEPIFPLRVVIDGPDAKHGVAQAEKILAHMVVRGMASGAPVQPITTIDLNVASGVLRSARDNRIHTMILEWEGTKTSRTRTVGRNVDEIIDKSSAMVLINRIVQSPNSVKTTVLLLPPWAHRQPGFDVVFQTVKTMASQVGSELQVHLNSQTQAECKYFVSLPEKTGKPQADLTTRIYETWKHQLVTLKDELSPNSWLFVFLPRKGDIMWQPSLDKLPGQLAVTLPNHNLSIITPPIPGRLEYSGGEEITKESPILSSFSAERCVFQADSGSSKEIISRLLSPTFGKFSSKLRGLTNLLFDISQEEPVELVQDVVLLHTHTSFVTESTVFLGVSKQPLDVPLSSTAPRILVILLDPDGQDPELHLRALGDVAKVIRLSGLVPSLQKIRNFQEFSQEVSARIH
jgi:Kef-type K+ transport system membrane component KefB/mannitol/fructose-specific phosphotransferase system IIA component (Ntr-type)